MGLLSLGPMSGYQMRQLIDESIGNFWTESYGQIYPTLKRLAAEGMVTFSTEQTEGRAERKVYSLTAAGKERLHDWLNLPVHERVPRNELLLKLFFGSLVPVDVLVRHVETFRALQQERLQRDAATAEELNRRHGKHPDLPYWMMTVNYGLHETRARIAWCDETLAQCHELKRRRGLQVVKKSRRERSTT